MRTTARSASTDGSSPARTGRDLRTCPPRRRSAHRRCVDRTSNPAIARTRVGYPVPVRHTVSTTDGGHMLAVRVHQVGDPSVLRVEEVPEPVEPVEDQILVHVHASSVNGTDLKRRTRRLPSFVGGGLPATLGVDVCGDVLRCGPRVTAFRPGDRVVALLGHLRGGGQAERVVLPQGSAALAPTTVSPIEAAALPLSGLTALQALFDGGRLRARSSPRVLVHGASGGVGSFAVQLAALAGGHVTGVASGAKLSHVRELGADVVVDRERSDVFASGERWDVILDTPGLLTAPRVRESLTDDGVLVSTRPFSGDGARAAAAARSRRRSSTYANTRTRPRSQDLAQLATLVDRGALRLPVTATYPMARVADAHRHMEGPAVGKLVIVVGA